MADLANDKTPLQVDQAKEPESIGHKVYKLWTGYVQNPLSKALAEEIEVKFNPYKAAMKFLFASFIIICVISAVMSWVDGKFAAFKGGRQQFKDCAFDPKDPNGLLNSTCDGWNSTSSGFVGQQNFSNDDTMNNMYQHFVPAGVKYQQKDKDDLPWGLGKCSDIVAEDSAQYGSDDYVDAVFAKSKQEQFYSPEEALLHQ